ncbi:MAG: hypothetical protein K2X93_20625 [Candidatus Obscuribacterales bacterium]|nr:hypothetical protein [Candidatus Obscuribacterales bacterium]
MLKVGVVGGLGLMASPMARHWKDSKIIQVTHVHDRGTAGARRDKCREAWKAHGAETVDTIADLGQCVLDGVIVCCGKNADDLPIVAHLADRLSKQSGSPFICHMSTVSTSFVDAAQKYCSTKGVSYVNYPLTGGSVGADNATMLILASGDRELFKQLEPALSKLGNPRFFGESSTAACKVKFIGQVMVFNGLIGICSAAALHTVALNDGKIGGEEQGAFFDFLNAGAGGTRQWDVILANGIKKDIWDSPFFARYGVVDSIYAAQMCIDEQVSSVAFHSVLRTALAFSFLVNHVDRNLATHAILREMIADRAKMLDDFIHKNSGAQDDCGTALQKCVESLPDDIRRTVELDVTPDSFERHAG